MATSLRDNPKFANIDDRRLVERSIVEPGVSRRTSGRYGGDGLKELRDVVVARGGRMTVSTGTIFAEVDDRGVRADYAPRLHGTTVELDFRPLPDDGRRADEGTEELF